jgi:hypothetical protein
MKAILLALLVSVCGATEAFAAEVTLGWRALSLTLQDLDPADGIAPWIATVQSRECVGSSFMPVCHEGSDPDFRPSSLQRRFQAPLGAGMTNPWPTETEVQSEGMLFELSPNTRLTIGGVLYTDDTGPEHSVEIVDDIRWVNDARAFGFAEVDLPWGVARVRLDSGIGPTQQAFSLVVDNTAPISNVWTLDLRVQATTESISIPSIIPEPATWVLMLPGLAVAGWAMRRHRRTSPRAHGGATLAL